MKAPTALPMVQIRTLHVFVFILLHHCKRDNEFKVVIITNLEQKQKSA